MKAVSQFFSSYNSSKGAYLFTGIFLVSAITLIVFANGTCDEGDSVMHYQFARWSWAHPALFFHHWAKPLYVLLASPLAQFGFNGIKVFNVLTACLCMLLTYKTCYKLAIPRSSLVIVLLAMAPAWLKHSLSGLTEPLFACIMCLSIFLYLKNRIVLAIIIVSFLPFIRSEGLIIAGIFGLLLLVERRWKIIPLLLTGHLVYGIAGAFIHGTVLWVFTHIPYARLGSVYGIGTWGHFFSNLPVITGIPLLVLLVAGLAYGLKELLTKSLIGRETLLVYGCFVSYFLAHVIFWALGIFNSFGMLRVLVAVMPLMAIIQLRGLNMLALLPFPKLIIRTAIVAVLLFPFVPENHYSWKFDRDFKLGNDQMLQLQMGKYIRQHFSDYQQRRYYFDANYISVVMDFDFFDEQKSRRVSEWVAQSDNKPCFVIWDDWYCAFEGGIPLDKLLHDQNLILVKEFSVVYGNGPARRTVLFINSP